MDFRYFFLSLTSNLFWRYGAEDIDVLAEDHTKRERFVEQFVGCIIPHHHSFVSMFLDKKHLLDFPDPANLPMFVGALALTGGDVPQLLREMAIYADSLEPLRVRWAVGNYEILTPQAPNMDRVSV